MSHRPRLSILHYMCLTVFAFLARSLTVAADDSPSHPDEKSPAASEETKPLTGLNNTPEGGTLPGGTMPGGTVPGGTLPGGTVPGRTLPGGPVPGGTVPVALCQEERCQVEPSSAARYQAARFRAGLCSDTAESKCCKGGASSPLKCQLLSA